MNTFEAQRQLTRHHAGYDLTPEEARAALDLLTSQYEALSGAVDAHLQEYADVIDTMDAVELVKHKA